MPTSIPVSAIRPNIDIDVEQMPRDWLDEQGLWIFSLSAECGAQQAVAEEFSHHFDQVSWVLSNGSQSRCRVGIFQDIEENWWCRVSPSHVSEIGIDTPESA
ncbi:MAG: hypothetical protein RLP02_02240, partial [Coleofasciculus sp. C2-GNP5-27]